MNGDDLDKSFCLQHGLMGIDGEESRKCFRNGDHGRGRGHTGTAKIAKVGQSRKFKKQNRGPNRRNLEAKR